MHRGSAYLISVAVAASAMQASFSYMGGTGPFEPEILPLLAVEWFIAFVLIAFASFFPAIGVTVLIDRYEKWRLGICVGSALITAAGFTILGAKFMTQSDGDPDQLTSSQAVPRYFFWTLPAGLTGGVCFWFCAFRTRLVSPT